MRYVYNVIWYLLNIFIHIYSGLYDINTIYLQYIFIFLFLYIDRHIGKMLIMGCLFKCIVPVLTIAAALCSSKSPFVSPPPHKRAEASEAHRKFAKSGENSDLLAIIHAYNAWVQIDSDSGRGNSNINSNGNSGCSGNSNVSKFCSDNYLNMTVLREMKQLRSFFRRHLEVLGFLEGEHNTRGSGGSGSGTSTGNSGGGEGLDGLGVDDGRYGDVEVEVEGGASGVKDDHDAGILGMNSSVGGVNTNNTTGGVIASTSSGNNKYYSGKKVENSLLRCVIGSGLFPNIVRVCRSAAKGSRGSGRGKGPGREDMRPVVVLDKHASSVFIHPSSLLSG